MMTRPTIFLAACAGLAACTGQPATTQASTVKADSSAVASEVKAAIRAQVDGYAKRDLDKIMGVMAPGYMWISHGQPNLSGEANVRPAIAAQLADPALVLSIADESVDVSDAGDMAVYRTTYRYTFTDPATKKPTTELGNWVAIFRRQDDGTMKLARDIIVDLPAPAATGS